MKFYCKLRKSVIFHGQHLGIWPRRQTFVLGLRLCLEYLASASALNFWPRLTSLLAIPSIYNLLSMCGDRLNALIPQSYQFIFLKIVNSEMGFVKQELQCSIVMSYDYAEKYRLKIVSS